MSATTGQPGSASPTGIDPLSTRVLEAFRRAAHANRQIFVRMVGVEKHGRPGRAVMLLVLGSASDGITQRQLAEVLHVSPPTVTVMLQKMEKSGLVERWTDEADQRLTRIRMTPKGRELAGPISDRFNAYIEASLGSMSVADRQELGRLLGVFADNMEAALKPPST